MQHGAATAAAWALGLALVAGVGSALLAGALLVVPERMRARLVPPLTTFAAGALLGAAFLHLLPEAFEGIGAPHAAGAVLLSGLLAFHVVESAILHRHGPTAPRGHGHVAPTGPLLLVSDGIHNLADGFAIGAAFLVSIPTGVLASLAVLAHEVPQEIGDMAILLRAGYRPARALAFNVLCNALAIVGAGLAVAVFHRAARAVPYALGITAAGFVYIATVDLLPLVHRDGSSGVRSTLLLFAGVGSMLAVHLLLA